VPSDLKYDLELRKVCCENFAGREDAGDYAYPKRRMRISRGCANTIAKIFQRRSRYQAFSG
jgi:hypothetical protein